MTAFEVIQFCYTLPTNETPFVCLSYGTMSYLRFLTTDAVLIAIRRGGKIQ